MNADHCCVLVVTKPQKTDLEILCVFRMCITSDCELEMKSWHRQADTWLWRGCKGELNLFNFRSPYSYQLGNNTGHKANCLLSDLSGSQISTRGLRLGTGQSKSERCVQHQSRVSEFKIEIQECYVLFCFFSTVLTEGFHPTKPEACIFQASIPLH